MRDALQKALGRPKLRNRLLDAKSNELPSAL
jgi:hypothetical protein